jgi:hypothetical protein
VSDPEVVEGLFPDEGVREHEDDDLDNDNNNIYSCSAINLNKDLHWTGANLTNLNFIAEKLALMIPIVNIFL